MRFFPPLVLLLCVSLATFVHAEDLPPLSPASERYIELLSNGGASSIRTVAQSMYRTDETDPRVLDVAAEVLLRDYQTALTGTEVDAMAWLINALSKAKTNRYQGVLAEVQENAAHKKTAKYARKRQDDDLPADEAYQAGMVSLQAVAGASATPTPQPVAAATAANYHPITVVKAGMSMQEAFDLAGPPTSSHQHQTGKNWNPFNYKGGDISRKQALYKGQGRIVLSNTSRYSDSWKVLEVIIDESESGYQ